MRTGLILRAHDLERFPYASLRENPPYRTVLFAQKPPDMRIIEIFSKLEIPLAAMFQIEMAVSDLLVDMTMQASLVGNTDTCYMRVDGSAGRESITVLENYINQLALRMNIVLFLAAPAAHFLRSDSLALNGLSMARNLGLRAHPFFMFSNVDESLSIFLKKDFLRLLHKEERAEFSLQFIVEKRSEQLEMLEKWERPIYFWNPSDYGWNKVRLEDVERKRLPFGTVAIATPRHDRVSAWTDPTCKERVTRKFNTGDTIYLAEDNPALFSARTLEGDYILRNLFEIKRV